MQKPVRLAVVGFGRMGSIHAFHALELAQEGKCTIAALCDAMPERAERFAADAGLKIPIFRSVQELADARVADASVVVTPTDCHREHAAALIKAGQRVFVEKPLTESVESDLEFAAELDRKNPNALMLAFQRRFDPPLQYARELLAAGTIGKAFKIYSGMEDSLPAPNGYQSPGILPDMSIHNVDEVLWLAGKMPDRALMIGSNIYSHRLTTCQEDFDDAQLYLWFGGDLMAEIQVGRNHVAGYRTETVIYGDQGEIQINHFHQKANEVLVRAYGRFGRPEPIAVRSFTMREYGRPLAEFAGRFGLAYVAELAAFLECCEAGRPFPVTHWDGARAQYVIRAGMRSSVKPETIAPLG